jgi:hypothetical protein
MAIDSGLGIREGVEKAVKVIAEGGAREALKRARA